MDGKYFAIENASSKYILGLVNPVNEEAGKEKEDGEEENDPNEMEAQKNQEFLWGLFSGVFPVLRTVPDT